MKSFLKEILLCLLIGFISFCLFVALGTFYNANDYVVMVNILVWTLCCLIAYASCIFLPFFEKKKFNYIDGYALSAGFIGIMIVSLCRVKDVNDASYLTVLGFISGILSIFETIVICSNKISMNLVKNRIEPIFFESIKNLPSNLQHSFVTLFQNFKVNEEFTLSNVAILLGCSEYKAKKIINKGIELKIITQKSDTKPILYSISDLHNSD